MTEIQRVPEDDDDDFREAQEGAYEPEPVIHDEDDLPVDDDEDDDRLLPDGDRPVALDPDDAEIA